MNPNKLCKLLLALCAISVLFATTSCEKEELIFVPAFEITNVGITTVTCTADLLGNYAAHKYGFCWSTSPNPKITDSIQVISFNYDGFVSCVINSLLPNTKYYMRTYATDKSGKTIYRNEKTFTTGVFGSVTDVDGNIYNTVKIGDQTWMAQNLMVTKYNDGTAIPNIADYTQWSSATSGAVCDYENISANSKTYGKLYNWHAVNTGKLCPTGWHVPSSNEWKELENSAKSKESIMDASSQFWVVSSYYTPLTNETGFTALPGGIRYGEGGYVSINESGYWWSASLSENEEYSKGINLSVYYNMGFNDNTKNSGLSVRCVKDQE